MRIPTVKVKDKDGNEFIINESDFDKDKHKKVTKPKSRQSQDDKE